LTRPAASYKLTRTPSGSGGPPRGPRPCDIIAHTQTLAAQEPQEPMPQRTLAASSRADHARPAERQHRLAHPRRQPATDRPDQRRWRLAAEARRRPPRPRGADQDAAALDSGGAGPGLCPEWARARCARIFRMTAGSCRVAIRRSRPPQWPHARTSMANARCMRAAQVQARGAGGRFARCRGPVERWT
jgi:hypothetical protein